MENKTKIFLEISKSYSANGKRYIQGIGTGTLEDRDGQRMSKTFLDKFLSKLPLPLTDAHERDGIFKDIGTVVSGTWVKDQNDPNTYHIDFTCELEEDNYAADQLCKNLLKGKKYGLSIQATEPVARTVFSKRLNKNIIEFVDAIPTNVSVTTRPSYIPSMLSVLAKSYKQTEEEMDKKAKDKKEVSESTEKVDNGNELSNNQDVKVKKENTETPEVPATEATPKTPEVKPAEKPVEAPEVKESPVAEPEKVEVTETPQDEVQKAAGMSNAEKLDAIVKMLAEMGYTVAIPTTDADTVDEEVEEIEVEKSVKSEDDTLSKSYIDEKFAKFEKMLEGVENVQKSLHEDVEKIASLPLQKKSKVQVMEKSFNDRKFTTPQASFTEAYKQISGNQ